jgi:hypothetical protein
LRFLRRRYEQDSFFESENVNIYPNLCYPSFRKQTAQFVKGKSDAKTYYGVLKAAFGDKLPSVLPQILANLPDKKAADLSKVSR